MAKKDKALNFKQKIYLIRHGETEWSLSKKHTGRSDIPLTPRGEKEALALKAQLQQINFKKIFSSPLIRVIKTCEIAGLMDRAVKSNDLLEWDYGDYEGLTTSQIREKHPQWNLFEFGVPKGESIETLAKRADHILQLASKTEGDVALFGSGHILRVIGVRWINLDAKKAQFLALSTASISVLGYEHEWRVISCWNDISHLKSLTVN